MHYVLVKVVLKGQLCPVLGLTVMVVERESFCTLYLISSSSMLIIFSDEADSRPLPVITDRPQNTTVPLTEDVELECKASGNPSPTIRWSHGGRPELADSRISINRGSLRITGRFGICANEKLLS